MEYLSSLKTAERWELSERRVRILCGEGKIAGAVRMGRAWKIPADSPRPADGRNLRGKNLSRELKPLLFEIEAKKTKAKLDQKAFELDFIFSCLPLSGHGLERDQLKSLFSEDITPAQLPFSNCLAAASLLCALKNTEHRAAAAEKLTEKLIKEINADVLAYCNEAPLYRQNDRTQLPLSESAMNIFIPARMKRLADEYETASKKLHAVEAAALICARMLLICPFQKANAETALLTAGHILRSQGYPIVLIENFDELFEAAEQFRTSGALWPVSRIFAEAVIKKLS